MQNEDHHNPKSKLQFYHFILLGCLLGCILVINSNYVNNKKMEIKLNKEKGALFDKIISKRNLQQITPAPSEEEVEVYATDDICSRASPELIKYYNNSGSLKDLGIKEGKIECEDKNEEYMKALIDILKKLLGDDKEEEDEDNERDPQHPNPDPGDGDGDGGAPAEPDGGRLRYRRQLRNALSIEGDTKTNLITYLKRLLPMLVALVSSILCIIGWVVCCFCNCCNCCCCCCCKKSGCKIPCFIWTFILYGGVVAVCIYGITQTKEIFVGLSNTECSIMRFFDEILFGEMKTTLPKWAGIEGINTILDDLSGVISSMGPSTYQALDNGLDEIEEEQEAFDNMLKQAGDNFYDEGNYMDGIYSKDYTGEGNYLETGNIEGRCVLDLIKKLGRYIPNTDDPSTGGYDENSFFNGWNMEYSTIAREANGQMQSARDGFEDILDRNLEKIQDTLDDAKSKFNDLQSPINNVYNSISEPLYDYSILIDDYGKDGVTLAFGALAIINIALAVLMFLICLCSGKMCVNCCCCRCICKLFTHILWNVLALLMIITLLIGAIVGIIGRIGGDMMSVLSFIMSEDNFNDRNPVILNKLGDALQYLNCCINGDGDIASLLNISDSINSFNQIHNAQGTIERAIDNFTQIKGTHRAYDLIIEYYNKRINYIDDPHNPNITAINLLHEDKFLVLYTLNGFLNTKISNLDPSMGDERWTLDGDKQKICGTANDPTYTSPVEFHPSTCKPRDRDWIKNLNPSVGQTQKDIKNYADLISDVVDMIENLKDETPGKFKKTMESLLESYQGYLDSYIDGLKKFNETINSITSILDEYIGGESGQTFAFLNGLFIGKNLKIILKYLKYSLGEDLYTVGLCLIIVGFSLIFSISSTILTIVIINVDIDLKKEIVKQEEIAEIDTENEDLRARRISMSRRRSKSKRRYSKY